MKYELTIESIKLNDDNTEDIELTIKKDINNSFAISRSRVEISVIANVFSEKDKDIIIKLLNLKEKYIDIELIYENTKYKINKMYIYNLTQSFSNGISKFKLLLYQKYIGKENELMTVENINK